MSSLGRAFSAMLRRGIAAMLQYRGEIVLWATWGLVYPAVSYALWSVAAEASEDGRVAGYGRGDFAAYFFVIMIIGHLTAAWDTYELGHLVRSGELSAKLLRPILPIWESLAHNLSYKITTLAFLVPTWGLFAWLVSPEFHTQAWQLGVGIVAIALAAVMNFILSYVVGLIAFWTPKLDATGELYFGAGMIFGGRFAPLDMFDKAHWTLRSTADILPFKWMFSFPAELIMGRITDSAAVMRGLGMQVAWLLFAIVAFKVFWKAAVKRYSAVSG